jgi:hypothetical protein
LKYYYLVASLPSLVIGEPPPFDSASLSARFANVLSKEDVEELQRVVDGRVEDGASGFSKRWTDTETQIRNAIVRIRAAKYTMEPGQSLRSHAGYDMSIEKNVVDAYAKANPLERELALDYFRWGRLDDLTRDDPFGFGAVLAFAVRLKMAERWAGLTEQEGLRRVDEIVNGMTSA